LALGALVQGEGNPTPSFNSCQVSSLHPGAEPRAHDSGALQAIRGQ
jgi:hypothetical protein